MVNQSNNTLKIGRRISQQILKPLSEARDASEMAQIICEKLFSLKAHFEKPLGYYECQAIL